jgi:SAM-dependent methyltransferase
MTDWSLGEYERTAKVLEPAAEVAVAELAPRAGERVLDVACGTGNAAALAVQAGASTIGLDGAERLVQVARERVPEAEFVVGDAADLPFQDGEFDAVVSVFGVIFAPIGTTVAELLRVTKPGGRIVLTTWIPSGPISKLTSVIRDAFGQPDPGHTWSDPEMVRDLFAGHPVEITEHEIPFVAESVDAYLDDQMTHHPMWIEGRGPLTQMGKLDHVMDRARELYSEANEDPDGFRITSRYWLVSVQRAG